MSFGVFHSVGRIAVGAGYAHDMGGFCRELKMTRPLLVTDRGLVDLGLIGPIIDALKAHCAEVVLFDGVEPDPSERVVGAGFNTLRVQGCDGVIAVGGGSSMDTAKVIAVLAQGRQSLQELYGVNQVMAGRYPLILVPTTAGTGSEVTPVAVITTGATTKAGISSPVLLPDVAVLDAALTLQLPPSVTAMTGIDAMVHAVEAYTSALRKNPLSDAMARQALTLLTHHVDRVLEAGDDLHAREAMLVGALLAGQAFANAPVAAVHALAYPLGGHYHIPHGLSNALMLPSVLRFNAPVVSTAYTELAALLPGGATPSAEALIMWFEALIERSGLPLTLAEAGVAEADLPTLAEDAMLQQRLLVNNPRPVQYDDALALYQRAFGRAM
jgi:alcohol dehydrogenase